MISKEFWDIRTSSTRCGERDMLNKCNNFRMLKKFKYPDNICCKENCPKKIPVDKMKEFFRDMTYNSFIHQGMSEGKIELEHGEYLTFKAEKILKEFIEKSQEEQRKWII